MYIILLDKERKEVIKNYNMNILQESELTKIIDDWAQLNNIQSFQFAVKRNSEQISCSINNEEEEDLKTTIEDLEEQVDDLEDELSDVERERDELQEEVDELEKMVEDLQSELEDTQLAYKNEISALELEYANLETKLNQISDNT